MKKYNRVMLGPKSVYAEQCYKGGFIFCLDGGNGSKEVQTSPKTIALRHIYSCSNHKVDNLLN